MTNYLSFLHMIAYGGVVVNPPLMKVTCPYPKGVESAEIPLITCSLFPISIHEEISKEIVVS